MNEKTKNKTEESRLNRPSIETLTRTDLIDRIREAKDDARDDADFCEAGGQILAIDKDGERVEGGPVDHFDSFPSLKRLREILAYYPDAVYLIVEGQSRYFAEYGDAATQRAESTPCDWWQVEIAR